MLLYECEIGTKKYKGTIEEIADETLYNPTYLQKVARGANVSKFINIKKIGKRVPVYMVRNSFDKSIVAEKATKYEVEFLTGIPADYVATYCRGRVGKKSGFEIIKLAGKYADVEDGGEND